MESTLVKSLGLSELKINLISISQFLISEIRHHDEKLANELEHVFDKLLKEQ